jgi:DNA-binding MarR family transcriptional regulator
MKLTDKRLSKRTIIALLLLRMERKYNRPISFNDLLKTSRMKKTTVSKCYDSLSDMGMVEDEWCLQDGYWYKGIILTKEARSLMTSIEKQIKNNEIPIVREINQISNNKINEIFNCDEIHDYFGLSYGHYLVIPRTALQSMPGKWQYEFVKLLIELDDSIDYLPKKGNYEVILRANNGKLISISEDIMNDYERGRRKVPIVNKGL